MTWAAAAVQSAGESVNHRRRTAMKELGLKSNTFYRKVKEAGL